MKSKVFVLQTALLIGMVVSIFSLGVQSGAEARSNISEDVFRLHIIANSDSREDQALKLKIRNAILEESGDIFDGALSAKEAAKLANAHLDDFRRTAEKVIYENGYDYDVKCEITEMYFDERTYGSVSLPAGNYNALRICVGNAEGKNWWCVMFPSLCLPAVTDTDEVLERALDDGALTEEEVEILKNPSNYEVRFYFADLIEKLAGYIKKQTKTGTE